MFNHHLKPQGKVKPEKKQSTQVRVLTAPLGAPTLNHLVFLNTIHNNHKKNGFKPCAKPPFIKLNN